MKIIKSLGHFFMALTLVLSVSVIKGYNFEVNNQTGEEIDIRLSIMTIIGPR